MMRRYAETTGCRRSFLLSYFGQEYSGPCGACDNDRRHAAARPSAKPFPIGVRVASERWGVGTIQRYDGDQVTVLFDEHGYRDLLVLLWSSAGSSPAPELDVGEQCWMTGCCWRRFGWCRPSRGRERRRAGPTTPPEARSVDLAIRRTRGPSHRGTYSLIPRPACRAR